MTQLVAPMSGVVQGGVVMVVGSSLARGKIFTASIGSLDSLYLSVFIYCTNLHQFMILCSSKAMMFVKLYFRTSDIYLISLVSLYPWIHQAFICELNRFHPLKRNQYTTCTACRRQYQRYLNILFWGCLSGALGSVDVWCSAMRC